MKACITQHSYTRVLQSSISVISTDTGYVVIVSTDTSTSLPFFKCVHNMILISLLLEQDIENDKLKLELVQSVEESSGLRVQNQKLFEETSYAKELASAAAVELKNLAGEVTSLSIQNKELEKELLAARQALNSRSTIAHTGNVRHRKHGENLWQGRRSRVSDRESEVPGVVRDGLGTWDLDTKDLKMELQARKQREAVLEAALVEKEILEDEYRKKVEEGKRREAALENDLANMWVLVSQLRKKNGATQDVKTVTERQNFGRRNMNDPEMFDSEYNDPILDDEQTVDHATSVAEILKEDPLVARLKVIMFNFFLKNKQTKKHKKNYAYPFLAT